jgi:hypothetical protein
MKRIGITLAHTIVTWPYIFSPIVTSRQVLNLSTRRCCYAYVTVCDPSNARGPKRIGLLNSVKTISIESEVSGRGCIENSNDKITQSVDPLLSDSSTLHLVSLPPLSDYSPKIIKDVWKWKDLVLGD